MGVGAGFGNGTGFGGGDVGAEVGGIEILVLSDEVVRGVVVWAFILPVLYFF